MKRQSVYLCPSCAVAHSFMERLELCPNEERYNSVCYAIKIGNQVKVEHVARVCTQGGGRQRHPNRAPVRKHRKDCGVAHMNDENTPSMARKKPTKKEKKRVFG